MNKHLPVKEMLQGGFKRRTHTNTHTHTCITCSWVSLEHENRYKVSEKTERVFKNRYLSILKMIYSEKPLNCEIVPPPLCVNEWLTKRVSQHVCPSIYGTDKALHYSHTITLWFTTSFSAFNPSLRIRTQQTPQPGNRTQEVIAGRRQLTPVSQRQITLLSFTWH